MEFGNWFVSESTIEWKAAGFQRFVIPADKLNTTRPGTSDAPAFYDWILKATDEDWLTQNDLYDLNYAFVYGMAKFKLDFNYEIFDATLEEQYEIFDAEEDEDATF